MLRSEIDSLFNILFTLLEAATLEDTSIRGVDSFATSVMSPCDIAAVDSDDCSIQAASKGAYLEILSGVSCIFW